MPWHMVVLSFIPSQGVFRKKVTKKWTFLFAGIPCIPILFVNVFRAFFVQNSGIKLEYVFYKLWSVEIVVMHQPWHGVLMVQHGLLCHIRCVSILNLPLAHPVWTTMETYKTPYKVRKNHMRWCRDTWSFYCFSLHGGMLKKGNNCCPATQRFEKWIYSAEFFPALYWCCKIHF